MDWFLGRVGGESVYLCGKLKNLWITVAFHLSSNSLDDKSNCYFLTAFCITILVREL